MQGSLEGCDDWFWNPHAEVSAHFGIGRKGEIHQYVSVLDTAFHAGSRRWNTRSIGVEFEGLYPGQLTQAQIESFFWMANGAKWPKYLLLRHSDVNPHKPNCPGPEFPFKEIKRRWRG